MATRTLFLTGGMSQETKLRRLQKAQEDSRIQSIHIVGQHFKDMTADDGGSITKAMSDLFHFDNHSRRWNNVKLSCCKGRLDLIVEAVLSANVRRLYVVAPEGDHGTDDEDDTMSTMSGISNGSSSSTLLPFWIALSFGLRSNKSLFVLGFHDICFRKSHMDLLSKGMKQNKSVMELSFQQCLFRLPENEDFGNIPDDRSVQSNYSTTSFRSRRSSSTSSSMVSRYATPHWSLAEGLAEWKNIQHLSFQNCRLTDQQCADILLSLSKNKYSNLMELTLEGNQCHTLGMDALGKLLDSPSSNLLVLDLSSQKLDDMIEFETDTVGFFPNPSLYLKGFAEGLASPNCRLRCLQLSDNQIDDANFRFLAQALGVRYDDKDNAYCSKRGSVCPSLQTLHMAWCKLSKVGMEELSKALQRNTTLKSLILYECEIDNEGLIKLASPNALRRMKGLKKLDLGGKQLFDNHGIEVFSQEMKGNMELEEVIMKIPKAFKLQSSHQGNGASQATFKPDEEDASTGSGDSNSTESSSDSSTLQRNRIGVYCDLNRAGRRFLVSQYKSSASSMSSTTSLWPLVLERVQEIGLTTINTDPWDVDIDVVLDARDDDDREDERRENQPEDSTSKNADGAGDNSSVVDYASLSDDVRKVNALYYLLRNGPLLEM